MKTTTQLPFTMHWLPCFPALNFVAHNAAFDVAVHAELFLMWFQHTL